jgi:hypothetical protein
LFESLERLARAVTQPEQETARLRKPGVLAGFEVVEPAKRRKFSDRWASAMACLYQAPGPAVRVLELKEPDWAELAPPTNWNSVPSSPELVAQVLKDLEPGQYPEFVYEQLVVEQQASRHLSDKACVSLLQNLYAAMQQERDPVTSCSWYDIYTTALEKRESRLFAFARPPLLRRLLSALGLETWKFEPRRVMLARCSQEVRDQVSKLRAKPATNQFIDLFRRLRYDTPPDFDTDRRVELLKDFRVGQESRKELVAEAVVIMQFFEMHVTLVYLWVQEQADQATTPDFQQILDDEVRSLLDSVEELGRLSFELGRDHPEGVKGWSVSYLIRTFKLLAMEVKTQLQRLLELVRNPGPKSVVVGHTMELADLTVASLGKIGSKFDRDSGEVEAPLPQLSRLRIARSNMATQDEADQQLVDFLLERRAVFALLENKAPPAVLTRACRALKVDTAQQAAHRLACLLSRDFLAAWLKARKVELRDGASRDEMYELYRTSL